MFNMTGTAERIKNARIAKNMTQMNIADALGVSYQAVSNWERGNSMPDIGKLGELYSGTRRTPPANTRSGAAGRGGER